MKHHKKWYNSKLFKKYFRKYSDWDEFNPPSGEKHPGRYKEDAIQCQNPECPREGMPISEHEAFYCAAKIILIKKVYKKIIFLIKKEDYKESLYICPFCGDDDIRNI